MTVEIKLTFANMDEAIAYLTRDKTAAAAAAATAPAPAETKAPKPAKADKPAASPPSAAPVPAPAPAAPETPPTESAELPYAPIGQRIAEMVAVSNPNSAANRTGIKAFFATLAEKYGTLVKTGQDVKAADRPELVLVLDKLAADANESMA
jgi:hypothetical protein